MKCLVMAALGASLAGLPAAEAPMPYGPVPTTAQLIRQTNEFYGFIHFTVNTFTDKEWGEGDEAEAVFQPENFDPAQIVRVAQEAGMRGLVLTCKHHDGFCLWPSAFTEHSVKHSPWKNGQGDVVRELADACRDGGLRFGVYLSPWDRHDGRYGTPAYLTYYRQQLRELLSNYGPISEVWFDGANGGSGFYGGRREERRIDNRTYYDWPHTWAMVRELQPGAVMFSDVGPGVRWVGNEAGQAGDPCWNVFDPDGQAPGHADSRLLNQGMRHGKEWIPAECDVSIRPGWFYHASEDHAVKTPAQLVDLYYASIGRGASLLLNVPPDRRGQIHAADEEALRGFRHIIDATFAENLARDARVRADSVRGPEKQFAAENLLDGDRETYWAAADTATNTAVEFDFGHPISFNVIRLREYLPLGQRVDTYGLDQWSQGAWVEVAKGSGIGNCRLIRSGWVKTERVKLRLAGPACPALSEFGLFVEPVGK